MSMLFFHFDGTDNSPNDACAPEHSISSITNVLKSHLLLGGRVKNQIDITPTCLPYRSFYYAGIGTYGSWLEQKINAALARRFAALITPLIDHPIIIEAIIDTVASIGWPNLNITQRPTTEVVFAH